MFPLTLGNNRRLGPEATASAPTGDFAKPFALANTLGAYFQREVMRRQTRGEKK